MKSTTQVRLDLCRSVSEQPDLLVLGAINRVTEMRIRMSRCLIWKYKWPSKQALDFVTHNGNVWR